MSDDEIDVEESLEAGKREIEYTIDYLTGLLQIDPEKVADMLRELADEVENDDG